MAKSTISPTGAIGAILATVAATWGTAHAAGTAPATRVSAGPLSQPAPGQLPNAAFKEMPYETLRRLYDHATQAAAYDDIDPEGTEAARWSCAWAGPRDTGVVPNEVFLNRLDDFLIPGVPPEGPLFPGVRDRIINRCLIVNRPSETVRLGVCKLQRASTHGTDFRIETSSPDTIYSDQPTLLTLRRSGLFLAFKADFPGEDAAGNRQTLSNYGYCFPHP